MQPNSHILICDDDSVVHEALRIIFTANGFRCSSAYDGADALKMFKTLDPDFVILDLVMPNVSGIEVCREIRKNSDVPIIFLSVMGEEIDRIVGIELGADDYVVKPFSSREVVARVKTILKRVSTKNQSTKKLSFDEISVDMERYEITVLGENIDVTPKEMQLLYFLVENKDRVITREQILSEVWGYDYFGNTRVVDTHIKRLRKRFSHMDVHFFINTIHGIGYKFEVKKS